MFRVTLKHHDEGTPMWVVTISRATFGNEPVSEYQHFPHGPDGIYSTCADALDPAEAAFHSAVNALRMTGTHVDYKSGTVRYRMFAKKYDGEA